MWHDRVREKREYWKEKLRKERNCGMRLGEERKNKKKRIKEKKRFEDWDKERKNTKKRERMKGEDGICGMRWEKERWNTKKR